MTDGRLRYEQAAGGFGEWVAELMDEDECAARSLLGLSSTAPLVLSEDLQRRGAFSWQIAAAVEGCEVDCGHPQRDRYAVLEKGLLTCDECRKPGTWADLPLRDGAYRDCDICGGNLPATARYAKLSHVVKGPPKVIVLARACLSCAECERALQVPPGPSMSLN